MPPLKYTQATQALEGLEGAPLLVLRYDGFIDAVNYEALEKSLGRARESEHRFVVLDFSGVRYINSSGMSAVIRFQELLKERGGQLLLAGVPRPVAVSMHLLGMTALIPFVKNLERAGELVRRLATGEAAGSDLSEFLERYGEGQQAPYRVPVRADHPDLVSRDARVLVLVPRRSRVTDVLRLRLRRLNGNFELLHSIEEALRRYEEIRPDLVVVDERVDPDGRFTEAVKLKRGRSLTSIIKIYGRGKTYGLPRQFWIWENDYLVDPFEIMELFSLAEAELQRVPRDRIQLLQQVRFEFRSIPELVEKASALGRTLLKDSGMSEAAATAMFAALKEAMDNAATHGNGWSPERSIDVNYLVERKRVVVEIEDEGPGFDFGYYVSRIRSRDALEEARRRIIEGGRKGGLGILLMYKCTDRIEYLGPGNAVRLEKRVA